MKIVHVKHSTNGDSRVAIGVPSFLEFKQANYYHIQDVVDLTNAFADELRERVQEHDWTKVTGPYQSWFYNDLCDAITGKIDFMNGEWAKVHYYELERHHLAQHAPDDVNMFDVIEMLCDCVAAGMARSGEIYQIKIPNEVLQRAISNTVELLKDHVIVDP